MRIHAERPDGKGRNRRLDVLSFAAIVFGFWVGGASLAQAAGDAVMPGLSEASATADASTVADPMAAAFSDSSAFTPMSNKEMGEQRGGFDGIAFGIFLSGTLQPNTQTLPPGLTVTSTTPNQIQVVGGIGNLAGASGIFQFTNIVGNLNVVNNNIIINVTLQPQSPGNAGSTFP